MSYTSHARQRLVNAVLSCKEHGNAGYLVALGQALHAHIANMMDAEQTAQAAIAAAATEPAVEAVAWAP